MRIAGTKKKSVRSAEILSILHNRISISIIDLTKAMNVSLSTIRRDVQELVEEGLVKQKAGQVEIAGAIGREQSFALRAMLGQGEKQRIAATALELIENGDIIFIGGGSTTLEFARLLQGKRRLTIITHSLRVASLLVDKAGIDLLVLGGAILPGEQTMHGHLTEWATQQFRANKIIYGIQAFSVQHGLTISQPVEVNTDRAIARMVDQIILLADHTKFGKVAPISVMPARDIHVIVTGRELDHQIADEIERAGIRLILA